MTPMNNLHRPTLDAYRLEILSNALTALTEEIQITLLRSAYSQVVKEAQDASCAIFTADGRIVAQPVVIPGHLGSMKFMLADVLKEIPRDTLVAGDVLITNDPYRGGSHLPDIALFRPIFFDNRHVGFAGCIVHYTDVGGMVPGSNPQRATELYQEGLVIPPCKLYEAGRANVTLHGIIRSNVRDPDIFFGDLRAQEAALLKGEQRVCDLVRRYGADEVSHAMEGLIAHTAAQAKAAIRAIPNGVFEFVDFMDHDGIDLTRPIRVQVRVEIEDEKIKLDFTGTDAQVKGPLNAPLSKTWTTVFYCLCCILPDDIAFNDGLTGVLDIYVPEGTLLNPRHPAPVNARSVTVNRIADTVLGAFAKAVPEKVGAQVCGVPTGVSFGGVDPRTKRSFVFYESYGGGMGGTMHGDGADGLSTGTSNAMNIPVEAIEIDYPIRITRYELVPDSGGSGQFRGGLGLLREYEMLAEDASINVRGDRTVFPPHGMAGGHDASCGAYFLENADGAKRSIPSKYSDRIKQGERLLVVTAGGGGYGDPHRRKRTEIAADLAEGFISAKRAQQDYGFDSDISDNPKKSA
jgi:N-methylhydantoinase B/oxoprolinase/acetone carboxylase alpha subunit